MHLQKNPQHSIPTLEDGENIVWDSHAICCYIIGKFAKNDALYPKDLYTRARIDQRLHFDSSILFPIIKNCAVRILRQQCYDIRPESVQAANDAYEMMEAFLADDAYLVGNSMTLADLATVTSITQLVTLYAMLDNTKYPKIQAWLNRMAELPYFYELNTKHVDRFKGVLTEKIAENKRMATLL